MEQYVQDHVRDLTFAFADIGPKPRRNIQRLLHGKRAGRRQKDNDDDEEAEHLDDVQKERS